ncbi:mandelate racemase/muconate lactonizing enzyme family protein [Ochrobactrum sp. EDr1-4]|uniref:mandelate racemase/muconate lactonizing enzyme family protein n=1 Tax=Ochrobactrum sp. EDr1-4 TaxID=3368622 RepID=UPI003BA1C654
MATIIDVADVRVDQIRILHARVPLQNPVRLGNAVIALRDYVCVEITLTSGEKGYATGYERNLPLFEVTQTAARSYIGATASRRAAPKLAALGATPAPRATMVRGASLCDIALTDAWCKHLGQPLWAVLGGVRDRVPVMPVIGYGMSADLAASQGGDLCKRGFRNIKLMIDGNNIDEDRTVIEALSGALPKGHGFGIDAHWSWKNLAEALPYCRMAESLGTRFIEDPFAPTQWRAIEELSRKLDTPLAVGEDVIDLQGFRDVAQCGGILRIDASVSGGISGAADAVVLAKAQNLPVIPHVFPFLHAHIAFANETVEAVEMIMPEVGADPIYDFYTHYPVIENGELLADTKPGAGTDINWEALAKYSIKQESMKL